MAKFSPGIFTTNQSGTGQGAVLIAGTGSVAAPLGTLPGSRPVSRGDYISIYATGLGAVTNPPPGGMQAFQSPLSLTTTTPVVTIGGVQAPVSFCGLAPGFVGLYQINAQVPASAPTGDVVPLALSIGGYSSNAISIAIQSSP